jgi:hypothetical protein
VLLKEARSDARATKSTEKSTKASPDSPAAFPKIAKFAAASKAC